MNEPDHVQMTGDPLDPLGLFEAAGPTLSENDPGGRDEDEKEAPAKGQWPSPTPQSTSGVGPYSIPATTAPPGQHWRLPGGPIDLAEEDGMETSSARACNICGRADGAHDPAPDPSPDRVLDRALYFKEQMWEARREVDRLREQLRYAIDALEGRPWTGWNTDAARDALALRGDADRD